jgi:transketolase
MKTAFARTLTEAALKDKRIVLLTGDFCFGLFDELQRERPLQYWNCGCAEQAMVGVSAGLAICGFRPVVYTITPFLLERAWEQIKLDVDEQCLPVVLVGFDDYKRDGPTHNPLSPRTMVNMLKNTYYTQPRNGLDVELVLKDALANAKPTFIRLQNEPKSTAKAWPAEGREA